MFVKDDYIKWKYVGEEEAYNLVSLIDLIGPKGDSGVSITDTTLNEKGELIITLSDGTENNLGAILTVYQVVFKDYNDYIIDIELLTYGEAATAPKVPSREGYTFIGWNQEFNYITSDLEVVAQYEVNTYEITFKDINGNIIEVQNVEYNQTFLPPVAPEIEGYAFVGWYYGEGIYAKRYSDQDVVKADSVLYPRFEKRELLVQFFDHDGELLFSEYIKYGTSAHAPQEPSREGYTFLGWDKDFTVVKNDLNIYSKYEANKYTITFDSNGGSEIEPLKNEYLSNIDLPISVKDGYVLAGWSDGENLYEDTYQIKGDATLTAVWSEANYFNLYFDVVGGEPLDFLNVLSYEYVNFLPTPTKASHVFLGWTYLGEKIETPFRYTFEKDITLIANWEEILEAIEYSTENEQVIINKYLGSGEELILPDTINEIPITKISAAAFKDNATLRTIKLGKYLIEVGDEASANMLNLENIEFKNATQVFGNQVFKDSNKLKNITLSSEAPYSLEYYFGSNSIIPESLASVTYSIGGTFIDKTLPQSALKNITLVLAEDTTEIPSFQFENATFKSIFIPKNVSSIGSYAFLKASDLESVSFQEECQIAKIEAGAFESAINLKNILIPKTVTNIGSYAFSDTGKLVIYVEASFKPSGWHPYWNPSERPVVWGYLETINDGTLNYALSRNGNAYVIGLLANPSTTAIIIPSQIHDYPVTHIIEGALRGNSDLTSVLIPETVTNIGFQAIYEGLVTIYAQASSKPSGWHLDWNPMKREVVWGYLETVNDGTLEYALSKNGNAYVIRMLEDSLRKDVVIPNKINDYVITDILTKAFYENTDLTSIIIANTVTNIGAFAFYEANNLSSISFEQNSQLRSIGLFAFGIVSSLESIIIPRSVTSVEYGAFFNCVLTIYAEASSIPSGWHTNWNISNSQVIWGYVGVE